MALRETLEGIYKNSGVPANEVATINQIVVPVLFDLGWDVYDRQETSEVRFEHPVDGSRGGGRVDIALMGLHNQFVLFVEAKKPGTPLDKHVDQLLKYAFRSGVSISVLTDGIVWQLYLLWEGGSLEDRQFSVLRFREDPIEQVEKQLKAFLSRSAVQSGEAKSEALGVLNRRKRESDLSRVLPDIWRKMLTEPDDELVNRVRSRVYAEFRLRPSADQVTELLAVTIVPTPPGSNIEPATPVPSQRERINIQKDTPPVSATVLGTTKRLRSGIDLLDFVAVQLYSRHGQDLLDKVAQISYKVQISRDRSDIDRPREIGTPGIFIDRNLTIKGIKARSYEWMKLFGYSDSDLQIHEE